MDLEGNEGNNKRPEAISTVLLGSTLEILEAWLLVLGLETG